MSEKGVTDPHASDHVELTENFYILNKKKNNVKIQVRLTDEGVYLRREAEEQNHISEQLIRIEDIIGSRYGTRLKKSTRGALSACKRAVDDESTQTTTNNGTVQKDISAYLYIYAYIKKDKPLRRHQTVRILRFRTHNTYEENLKAAERWHRGISLRKGGADVGHRHGMMHDDKQLLILLNPKSGSGKGREMFQKQVAPVLKQAEVPYELLVTTHANFAREYVRKRKDLLLQYSGVVVAAGDGLFYEVLNGMMERTDWQMVSRSLPIGIIPCGSGNGLAKSIAHLHNEPYDPKPILNATLTCVSGRSALMDIVRVEVSKGDKHTVMFSFLSVGWGLIADIDIESERLRSIGSPRFTLWSVHRVISLRTYKGRLSYLLWRKENAGNNENVVKAAPTPALATTAVQSNDEQLRNEPVMLSTQQFHDASDEDFNGDDEFADAVSLDHVGTRRHIDSWHSTASRHTAFYSIAGQSMRSQRSNYNKMEEANAGFEMSAPVSSIPPLHMPLPDTWHSEEGEYVMVHAGYTTHLASDCYFAPDSRLNDGIIYLVIIRAGASRSQLVQFLLSLSSGTHLPEEPNEHIQVVPVSAFRIEPQSQDGIIAVDGERVDYGPIQGEILPSMIRVMVPHDSK